MIPRTAVVTLTLTLAFAAQGAAQVFSTPLLKPNGGRPDNGGLPTGEIDGVGVEQKLDSIVDLDTPFLDQDDRPLLAKDLFDGQRPVLMTFNFSDCPTQCNVQLTLLSEALAQVQLTAGKDYRLATLSLDHTENVVKAKNGQTRYLQEMGREGADWTFLRATESNLLRFTESVGYRFKWTEDANKIAHYPVVLFLTPTGRISRYLGGLTRADDGMLYEPKVLELSIIEASEGKIGDFYTDLFFLCFAYDQHTGQYVLFATNFLLVGAAITVVALAWFLWRMFRLEAARRLEAERAGMVNG